MTAASLLGLIGARGQYVNGTLYIPVVITDAREVFGRVDVCIEPVGGSGQQWVSRSNVRIITEGGTP